MNVWQSVIDKETCDWCRQRHGKEAKPPSPSLKCTSGLGCRCVAVESVLPNLHGQHVMQVLSAGVPVVYDLPIGVTHRAFLHALLAASPINGSSVECPGLDRLLVVRHAVVRREAVHLRCRAESLDAHEIEQLTKAGWQIVAAL